MYNQHCSTEQFNFVMMAPSNIDRFPGLPESRDAFLFLEHHEGHTCQDDEDTNFRCLPVGNTEQS